MAHKIFIASASESKPLATAIAQELARAGYQPLRWWQEIPSGSITIDHLAEIAKSVNGAVFLLTSVDKTWYRDEVSEGPRDNVILEYGLFVAHHGRSRTLIITDPKTKLPSDISGVNYERNLEDVSTVAEQTVKFFERGGRLTRFYRRLGRSARCRSCRFGSADDVSSPCKLAST
jgi:predicted nucleotide-binding protein